MISLLAQIILGPTVAASPPMVDFRILKGGGKAKKRIAAVDFRRAGLGLFRHLLRRIPWETMLESRGVQEHWLIFKFIMTQPF